MQLIWYAALVLLLGIGAIGAAMLGLGGGFLYTPLQVIFGVDIHTAATTSLTLIILLSLTATRTYRRVGMVDWGLALVLEIASVTGSMLAGYFSALIPARALIILLIAVLIGVGLLMLLRTKAPVAIPHEGRSWYHWHREKDTHAYTVNLLIALPVAWVAGVLSGLLGVGGGIVKVPLMVMMLGIPMKIAVATSAFMVGITAMGGFAGHAIAGHWDWKLTLLFAPAIIIGARVGAHIMLKTGKERLKKIFGITVIIIAAFLIYRII